MAFGWNLGEAKNVLWAVVLFQGVVIFVLLRQLRIMYLGTAQGVARDGFIVS